MSSDSHSPWNDLTGKIALELVFAEVGKDEGLLPVNSLLAQLEETTKNQSPPPLVQRGLSLARGWVDASLLAGGFTASALSRLRAWVDWAQSVERSLRQNQAPPELPAACSGPEEPSGPSAFTVAPGGGDTPAPAAEVLTLNLANDRDLLREFIDESREHLRIVEQGVLVLEKNPSDSDTLHAVFRAFHTFKGGSGFLNLVPINRLAHELESLLDRSRQGRLAINAEVINLILQGGDTLKRFVQEIEIQVGNQQPPQPILIPTHGLLRQIQHLLQRDLVATTAPVPSADPHAQEAAATDNGNLNSLKSTTGIVKVDTQKLDSLVDLVGEMVIAQSLVAQDPDLQTLASPQLSRHLAQLGRTTAELQKMAMSLRMVPIGSLFQKMNRLVRDLALKAGKQVELTFSGEETELDRNIIEELDAPLVHMLRNAVDHGIERSEVRLAGGKPTAGTVHLRAFHQGGNIVIEVQDNGAGLNKERIRAKGLEAGLIQPEEVLADKDIFNLIFAPGFSTAEKITDISGRGVGMDVVRRNIGNLRGKIEIESTPGQGTTFSLHLPLTLAIIDGLLISVSGQRFILPTLSVRESFRPSAAMLSTVCGRGEMVNVRGRLCPLLRLYEYFGLEAKTSDPTQAIVVVLESNHEDRCLLVDQLLGKQEVVIKSLGSMFKQVPAVAGAAILGDGRVGLILDVNALVHLHADRLAHAA